MAMAPDRVLLFIDLLTHHRLKRLALSYDTTIIELVRELVESEWAKKKGLETETIHRKRKEKKG